MPNLLAKTFERRIASECGNSNQARSRLCYECPCRVIALRRRVSEILGRRLLYVANLINRKFPAMRTSFFAVRSTCNTLPIPQECGVGAQRSGAPRSQKNKTPPRRRGAPGGMTNINQLRSSISQEERGGAFLLPLLLCLLMTGANFCKK